MSLTTGTHTGRRARTPSLRGPLAVLVACCLALAGCLGAGPATETGSELDGTADTSTRPTAGAGDTVSLRGHVVDEAIVPVADATVTLVTRNISVQTQSDGSFDLGAQPRGILPLRATAAGYLPTNITVLPDGDTKNVRLVLMRGSPVTPYNETYAFDGLLQCALEAAIISPSCDSLLVAGGQEPVFGSDQSFFFQAGATWQTVVIDVVFDGAQHPGLDGLRIALRGSTDPEDTGEYAQYGRWHGPEPFTVRVEPGRNYTDSVGAVPSGPLGFQLDVYPHSHAYHPGGAGVLGVGAGVDVEFELFITVFYVEAAPEGYSFASG